jgi:transcriptional regulator with PAS, ATPase and Fis domain
MAGAVTSDLPVLLTGETGVGKEIYAWSIHGQSARAGGPMQVVNASAIPESLLEAILFGAAEGAATGVRQQPGLIRQADGGTFFFDEIGEMSPALQSKLLRVLDDGHVLPVGGTQRVRVDVRFIAATNRDLRAEVGQGRFREDLFHRLRGHEFTIPPLRDHPEDVPLYVNAFLQEECTRAGRFVAGVTMHAMELLLACPWPGNVRELEMTLRRIVNELRDDRPITHEDLPEEIRRQARDSNRDDGLEARVDAMRRRHVVEALAASGGNRSDAARRLGLSRNGLRALITRLGIE